MSEISKKEFMDKHINQWRTSDSSSAFKSTGAISSSKLAQHIKGSSYKDINTYTERAVDITICYTFSRLDRSAVIISVNKSKTKAIECAKTTIDQANKTLVKSILIDN